MSTMYTLWFQNELTGKDCYDFDARDTYDIEDVTELRGRHIQAGDVVWIEDGDGNCVDWETVITRGR